ncbi:GPI mannosyltransferase 3 [Glycine max]|nr:GPI mannosyltransferase 3 [Glycine max]
MFDVLAAFHSPILCMKIENLTLSQLFSHFSNWFMLYCFSRTLSNSLRLFSILLALRETFQQLFLCFKEVGFGCGSSGLCLSDQQVQSHGCVFACLSFSRHITDSDSFFWRRLLWNSQVALVLHSGISSHDLSHLPFCIAGIIYSKQWKFHGLLAWVLGFYSLLGHKEFRFVLPVLPIVLMFSVYSLAMIEDPGYAQYKGNKSSKKHTRFPPKMGAAILFLLATNIRMALYMSLVHRRGPEDVMNHLAREALHGKVKSILFLMPCHATPYYSMLHHNLPMQFLDCTPSEEKGVPDESDRFLMDPVTFVSEYAKNKSLPSHVVLFDSEEQKLRNLLISFDYREEKRFFNAHFKVDRDLAYTCE